MNVLLLLCVFSKPIDIDQGKQEKEVELLDGANNEEADKDDKEEKSRNKAQYSGGLVLEPKKGKLFAFGI